MGVQLNHTIVASRDPEASARWYAEVFGFAEPEELPPFWQVTTGNAVNLDFIEHDDDIAAQHYAFLVSEPEFDQIFERFTARGVDHFADPAGRQRGQINHHDGGRGTYFADPDGHWLEIITRPYGAGD